MGSKFCGFGVLVIVMTVVGFTACTSQLNVPSGAVSVPGSSGLSGCSLATPHFQFTINTAYYPWGLGISPLTGNLYVAENYSCYCSPKPSHGGGFLPKGTPGAIHASIVSATVEEFDANGNLVTSWNTGLSYPLGVAVSPSTGNVYVADYYNGILEFTANGQPVTGWSGFNYQQHSYQYGPYDVKFEKTGNLLVLDYSNYLVERITPNGQVVGVLGVQTPIWPYCLAVAQDGNIFTFGKDNYGWETDEYSNGGTYMKTIANYGGSCGQVYYSYGMSVGPDGKLYEIDVDNNNVSEFDPHGNFLGRWSDGTRVDYAWGIAAASDGSIYVSNSDYGHYVHKYR